MPLLFGVYCACVATVTAILVYIGGDPNAKPNYEDDQDYLIDWDLP